MAERKKIGAKEIGIDPNTGKEKDLFKWFLASYLLGKHIRQEAGRDTYKIFVDSGLDSADRISKAGWKKLVSKLDEGGFNRYDESTASNLLAISGKLKEEYGGRVTNVFRSSRDRKDLQRRLDEFRGVGPKTIEIFLRDISDPESMLSRRSKKNAA